MTGLLPMWPIYTGLAILMAALILWIVLYGRWDDDD
jgi:hypothetical protein